MQAESWVEINAVVPSDDLLSIPQSRLWASISQFYNPVGKAST